MAVFLFLSALGDFWCIIWALSVHDVVDLTKNYLLGSEITLKLHTNYLMFFSISYCSLYLTKWTTKSENVEPILGFIYYSGDSLLEIVEWLKILSLEVFLQFCNKTDVNLKFKIKRTYFSMYFLRL